MDESAARRSAMTELVLAAASDRAPIAVRVFLDQFANADVGHFTHEILELAFFGVLPFDLAAEEITLRASPASAEAVRRALREWAAPWVCSCAAVLECCELPEAAHAFAASAFDFFGHITYRNTDSAISRSSF